MCHQPSKHSALLTQDAHTAGAGRLLLWFSLVSWVSCGRVFCDVYGVYWLNPKPCLFILPEIVNMNQYNAALKVSFSVLGNISIQYIWRKSAAFNERHIWFIYIFPEVVMGNLNHFHESVLLKSQFQRTDSVVVSLRNYVINALIKSHEAT